MVRVCTKRMYNYFIHVLRKHNNISFLLLLKERNAHIITGLATPEWSIIDTLNGGGMGMLDYKDCQIDQTGRFIVHGFNTYLINSQGCILLKDRKTHIIDPITTQINFEFLRKYTQPLQNIALFNLQEPLVSRVNKDTFMKLMELHKDAEQLYCLHQLVQLRDIITPTIRRAIIRLDKKEPYSTFERYIPIEFHQVFDNFVYLPLIESHSHREFYEELDITIRQERKRLL